MAGFKFRKFKKSLVLNNCSKNNLKNNTIKKDVKKVIEKIL